MSALAISDGATATPGTVTPVPNGRPHLYLVPDPGRIAATHRRASAAGVQLTERGLLAVLVVFGLLALTSAAVIIGSFFAVSDAPVGVASGTQMASGAVH